MKQKIDVPASGTVNSDADNADKGLVWYLAYGSNMNRDVFEKRRSISPADSRSCRVPGYFLSFDIHGTPYVEPCFASVLKHDPPNGVITQAYARAVHDRCAYGTPFKWDPNNPEASLPPMLHGVAHLITHAQFQRVIETEGGWGQDDIPVGYAVIEVDCVTYENERITAKTLIAKPESVQPRCQATPRYLNLLRKGAKQHEMSPTYQVYLDALESFHVESVRKRIGKYIFVTIFTPIYAPFIASILLSLKYKRNLPRFWAWYGVYANRLIRFTHNYMFSPIFGSGLRTREAFISNL